ncbi:hypothetical protein Y88_3369 [Novosphingobium nitrogenifigens DSM 19370]|uniref:Uncharacterized protein n=1 Tax=Novosphingobium nitrogenifigens DSM 19370 TaxID=983920 RepID=F1Z3E6_9SPHN|nr:hypothetical protein [Novosphingobium nitrogenifigens]EGD60867.1 hypothetical protein Y88_3369 [Novosphingobium nitrogenifigens DSM 19370]
MTLLGGAATAATILRMTEDALRDVLDGEPHLHTGTLEAVARALIAHADACRALERRLSPAFAENLTPAQARPPRR